MKFRWRKVEFLILLFVWSFWLLSMTFKAQWFLFIDNWFMSLTMAFGSFIAGATSEGGGAVAFPVMTLMFGIEPRVARDFALMIQSVGMSAAAIAIICGRIRIETRAIIFASLGGIVGIIIGLEILAPLLNPAATKLFFVTLWLSFGIALLLMNRDSRRTTNQVISNFQTQDIAKLITVGVLGGLVSGITGSGLDILTFSLLVLMFRIDEKIATPTSVILMSINSLVGVTWRIFFSQILLSLDSWNYWWVSVPVVVIGAPLGAKFITTRSRNFIVNLLLISIVAQTIAAFLIIPLTPSLMLLSIMTFSSGLIGFLFMAYMGQQRLLMKKKLPTPLH